MLKEILYILAKSHYNCSFKIQIKEVRYLYCSEIGKGFYVN